MSAAHTHAYAVNDAHDVERHELGTLINISSHLRSQVSAFQPHAVCPSAQGFVPFKPQLPTQQPWQPAKCGVQEWAQAGAARMYQRARLVQLAALELHCADLAVQDASCKNLLTSFFLPMDGDTDDDTGGES